MSSLFPIVRWANLTIYDTKAKCRHPKKIDLERDFVAGVYLSEAPSPPRFLFWGGKAIF